MADSGRFEEIRGIAHDLEGWRALITASLPPFQRVENPGEGPFRGRLSRQNLDRISVNLIEIRSSHHVIHRTETHIRNTVEPLYVVMFQLTGQSVFTQAATTAELHPGEYTLSTSTVPFDWEFFGDFSVLMLRFPQALIDAPPLSLLPLTGHPMTAENSFGRLLSPFVTSLAQDPDIFRGHLGRRIAQNLVDLFTTSFIANLEDRAALGPGVTAPIFIRLTEYIGRHLQDPSLTPAKIAAGNFVSLRLLQSIFHEHGTTVSSWVRERRLGSVRRDLALPPLADRTIRELAEKWGFEDQAHFSRLFKLEFGETPRQWRARAFSYVQYSDRRPIVDDDRPRDEEL